MKFPVLGLMFSTLFLGLSWSHPLVEFDKDTLVIDDFEDENFTSNLGPWTFAKDNWEMSDFSKSIVWSEERQSKVLKIDFSFLKEYDWYDAEDEWAWIEARAVLSPDHSPVDLSNCTEILFDYNLDGDFFYWDYFRFRVQGDEEHAYVNADYHFARFYDSDEWQTARFVWRDFQQEGRGPSVDASIVQKHMVAFSWFWHSHDIVDGSLEIDNIRCVNTPTHTVKFYKGDELLKEETYLHGEWPSYNDDYFMTDAYEYWIRGWNPYLSKVTEDISYYAVVDSTIRTYTVSFYDADEDHIYSQEMPYGTTPEYYGILPSKSATESETYTFKGWGKRVCDEDVWYDCHVEPTGLESVAGDADYYPIFDSETRKYTVKFVDYDGALISKNSYDYGTEVDDIVFPPNPSRPSAGGIDYTFDQWFPYPWTVTEDVVYVAAYRSSAEDEDMKRIVMYVNGDSVLQVEELSLDEEYQYKGEEPTREASVDRYYTFANWEDHTYWTASGAYTINNAWFYGDTRKYWIVLLDEDDSVIDSVQYEYGEYIYEGELKSKASTDGNYELKQWTPALARVFGRMEYKASYRYRVSFVTDEGDTLYSDYYSLG